MNYYLVSAGILTILIGIVHSIMGELKIIGPIQKLDVLPVTQGSIQQTKRTLRFAWHVTSILGVGIGIILLYYANLKQLERNELVLNTCALTLFAGFLVSLFGSHARHPAWFALLAASILTWIGGNY